MQSFVNYLFYVVEKKSRIGLISSSGRNFTGKICVYHRGGGNKKCSLKIDFFRRINSFGFITKIFKDSAFTSFIGLILYENGLSNYILLSEGSFVAKRIYSGVKSLDFTTGSTVMLSSANLFSSINNFEFYPYAGSIYSRAAGSSAVITSKSNDKVLIKFKSGWNVLLSDYCLSTLGISSNSLNKFKSIKKAGIRRALGIRPTVRGVAMNPCDHPHGGGEGKKSPPVGARSPWGWLTKGTPTKIKKNQLLKKGKFKNIR